MHLAPRTLPDGSASQRCNGHPVGPAARCAALRSAWRHPRWQAPLAWALTLTLAILIFSLWPELDLRASAAVHQPAGGFLWSEALWVEALYLAIPWLGRAALLLCLLVACWPDGARRSGLLRPWRPRALAVVAVLLVGVWGVVNAGLKEHIGRPRPVAVQAFGGPHPFHALGQSSDACSRNCSFVSGHAATGFALMGFGLLGAPGVRRRWARLGLAAGSLVGLGRVLQGGHFLSDIVFAGLAIGGTCLLLRRLWLLWRWQRRQVAATLQLA
jgi:membrane-associated PAP2 superfamily phosphatase